MPRYEHSGTKFWTIELAGKQLTTRFGKIGSPGQTRLKKLASPAVARAELERMVAGKVKEGYQLVAAATPARRAPAVTTASNPQLERAIEADPYDIEAYSVYADFLQDAGDPRGELIALQLAGKTKAATKLLAKHAEYFLGPLAEHAKTFDGSNRDAFSWKFGFIHGLRLSHNHYAYEFDATAAKPPCSLAEMLTQVLAHPSGRFVTEIAFRFNNDPNEDNLQSLIDVLAKRAPPTIRKLHFGDYLFAGGGQIGMYGTETEISWYSIGKLGRLWKAVPGLRHLITQGGSQQSSLAGGMKLGAIDLPNLVHAEFRTGGLDKANARAIAKARLPRIERLDVWYGDHSYGGDATPKDVGLLLARTDLPKLRHLGIMNTRFADELVPLLAASPLVRQLAVLDFSMGTLTDDGARLIAKHRGAFSHLEVLDVSHNLLSATGISALEACANKVVSKKQREDDPNYRYPVIGE